MLQTRFKLLIAGVIMAIGITLLAIAGIKDGWVYFLPVDQFVESDSYHTQRVRLHGVVGEENFDQQRSMLLAKFDLCGTTQRVRVVYSGVIPEMFQIGRDVVVEGRLDEERVFQADTLMTKCASKYESDDGQAPHADPRGASGADAQ